MTFALPVTLEGAHVRLAPLALSDAEDAAAALEDGDLWKLWYTFIPKPDGALKEIERRLSLQAAGSMLPFVVRQKPGDGGRSRVLGMTSLMNIDAANRRVEIGSTWYRESVQRTAVNTECKQLLLAHAFETLRCIAVEFRTNAFNRASRNAILRIGAKQDGILRNHQIGLHEDSGGAYRDTVVFSILESEWPAVKANLRFLLAKGARK